MESELPYIGQHHLYLWLLSAAQSESLARSSCIVG